MSVFRKSMGAVVILVAICVLSGCGSGGSADTLTAAGTQPPASTGIPTLAFGAPTTNGAVVTFPLNITNSSGKSISGIEADIGFDSSKFALQMSGTTPVSAVSGAAATAAGKTINQNKSLSQVNVLHIAIIDVGGNKSIGDGVVAQVSFTLVQGATLSGYVFSVTPTATDSHASPVTIIAGI